MSKPSVRKQKKQKDRERRIAKNVPHSAQREERAQLEIT